MESEQKKDIILYLFQRAGIQVSTEPIEQLVRLAQEVSFPKQSPILGIGDRMYYVYLIVQGMARSYYIDEKGNDFTKLFLRENEFLMGEALFMEQSLEAFESIEPLKCLRFDAVRAIWCRENRKC